MSSLSGAAVAKTLLVNELEFVITAKQEADPLVGGCKVKAGKLPSGATQVLALAAAGELWVDTASSNVIKLGV